ncbi:MAG: hypothetical protein WCF67_25100 [Chitinophagaceae bacterium]
MKSLYLVLMLFIATNCLGQVDRKVSAFLSLQANKTIYDRTRTNNSAGIGLGLQVQVNSGTQVKPVIELNGDLFGGTKELYIDDSGAPVDSKEDVVGVYAGPLLQASERLFFSATLGTSIYNSKAHFGIRPSIGIYPSKSKKWMAKASFTNIFQRDAISNQGFGYLSLAVGIKLF